MKKKTAWEFSEAGGRRKGFNNAMLQHFDGSNYYLAREIIQNSIDAKSKTKEPVIVEFDLQYFEQHEFPDINNLKESMLACMDSWPKKDFKSLHEFYENGIKVLTGKKIPVLRISDYNTKGLSGNDFERGSQWFSLVQSEGASNKSEGSGGSFGIGKGAPIMASELRTVFYLTVDEKKKLIFQGVSELVNHVKGVKEYDECGFFGYPGQKSIRDVKDVDRKFWEKRQSRSGLDVFIMGFRNIENWEEEMIKSVLRNFWNAIFLNELEVCIGSTRINSANIEENLYKHFGIYRDGDDVEPVGNPLEYFLAVKNEIPVEAVLKELGKVSFYFRETEEYINHVAMMRKSHMVIFSKTFRFPGNFCGVFICDDIKGNQELRKMEPPAHDKWIPERNIERGKKIYNEISDFIRKCIEDHKVKVDSEYSEIPNLHKYLPDNEEGEIGDGAGEEDYTGKEGVEETTKEIQKKEIFDTPSVISPSKILVINKKEKGNDLPDPIPREKKETKTPRKRIKREEDKMGIRVFNSGVKDERYEYTVILTANKTGKYDIRFYSVGDDLTDKLKILDLSLINKQRHHFVENLIKKVELKKDVKTEFKIGVTSKFKNALKIEVDEIQ